MTTVAERKGEGGVIEMLVNRYSVPLVENLGKGHSKTSEGVPQEITISSFTFNLCRPPPIG